MSEFQQAMRLATAKFSTAIRRIDYPIHKGQPNPRHGMYHFVGSVPVTCVDTYYATEEAAIEAARAAGATRIQRTDCSFA